MLVLTGRRNVSIIDKPHCASHTKSPIHDIEFKMFLSLTGAQEVTLCMCFCASVYVSVIFLAAKKQL